MRRFALLKAGFSALRCSSLNLSASVTPTWQEGWPLPSYRFSQGTAPWWFGNHHTHVKHHTHVRDSLKSFIFISRISIFYCCCCWCHVTALWGYLRSLAMLLHVEVPGFSLSLHVVKKPFFFNFLAIFKV